MSSSVSRPVHSQGPRPLGLRVHTNHAARWRRRRHVGLRTNTQVMKTHALLDALRAGGWDAAFGGARRDEERSRVRRKESSPSRPPRAVGPEEPAARIWNLFNGKVKGETSARSALQLDQARRHGSRLAGGAPDRAALLRGAATGRRARRHTLLMVDDDRFPLRRARAGTEMVPVPHARLLPTGRRVRRHHPAFGSSPR